MKKRFAICLAMLLLVGGVVTALAQSGNTPPPPPPPPPPPCTKSCVVIDIGGHNAGSRVVQYAGLAHELERAIEAWERTSSVESLSAVKSAAQKLAAVLRDAPRDRRDVVFVFINSTNERGKSERDDRRGQERDRQERLIRVLREVGLPVAVGRFE